MIFKCKIECTHKKCGSVEAGTAGLTGRHLIFRLHSVRLEGSGQLMSTMTFSSWAAAVAFNHGWLGDRAQSPSKLEVVCRCMTGCNNWSFLCSPLHFLGKIELWHFLKESISPTAFPARVLNWEPPHAEREQNYSLLVQPCELHYVQ